MPYPTRISSTVGDKMGAEVQAKSLAVIMHLDGSCVYFPLLAGHIISSQYKPPDEGPKMLQTQLVLATIEKKGTIITGNAIGDKHL